jgi:hypothetical protein
VEGHVDNEVEAAIRRDLERRAAPDYDSAIDDEDDGDVEDANEEDQGGRDVGAGDESEGDS